MHLQVHVTPSHNFNSPVLYKNTHMSQDKAFSENIHIFTMDGTENNRGGGGGAEEPSWGWGMDIVQNNTRTMFGVLSCT